MKKSKIIEVFNGEIIEVWKDGEDYFFATPFATLIFDEEMWEY